MIGDKIKRLRKSVGLNQADFAAKIGIRQGHLSEVERNVKNPGSKVIISLMRSFPDIDMDFLTEEGKTGEKQCSEAVQQEKQVQEIWTKEKDRLSMYAWGSRMTPDSIEEDDFLIVDTTIEPKKGDYVYRKGEDGPEIVRYQEGDAVPIGVLIGLKREYR